ncbi:hypothetical protein [Cohnella nanjingensis]|uniref:DNA-binding protein n=1 Tax=Cohnella nanjingensis TaxID=1387779 RepID=A0A7X0RR33_9BACL|nr:hypothetical protein [Cohnella nanjingensis]MBB6672147.1 hypothetical protein [Cohnella nanjingensis]
MEPFKHIYSTKKIAAILNKTDRQIRNMCRAGSLNARQLDPDDPKSPWMVYYPPTAYKKGEHQDE